MICPYCGQTISWNTPDQKVVMGNRTISCDTCGHIFIVPRTELQPFFERYPITYTKNIYNGGSDSGDSTVVIYDGDVEIQYENSAFVGIFNPDTEPQEGQDLVVEFNGQTYQLSYNTSDKEWQDDDITVVEFEGEYVFVIINTSLLPSQDSPQTVSVKITQEQSGGEDEESEFSIARVGVYNGTNADLSSTIPVIDGEVLQTANTVYVGSNNFLIPLYKGQAVMAIYDIPYEYNIATCDDIAYSPDTNSFTISGDGSVNIFQMD